MIIRGTPFDQVTRITINRLDMAVRTKKALYAISATSPHHHCPFDPDVKVWISEITITNIAEMRLHHFANRMNNDPREAAQIDSHPFRYKCPELRLVATLKAQIDAERPEQAPAIQAKAFPRVFLRKARRTEERCRLVKILFVQGETSELSRSSNRCS